VANTWAARMIERSPTSYQRIATGSASDPGDFTNGSSTSSLAQFWQGNHIWYITSSATAAQFAMVYAGILGLGSSDLWNGTSYNASHPWADLNWGRRLGFSTMVYTTFGSGTPYSHTTYQITLGKNGHANGLLASGDFAIGVDITNPTSNVVNVYATACNGTTPFVSGTPIFTGPSNAVLNIHGWVDGNGNYTLDVNRSRQTYLATAPSVGFGTGGVSVCIETVATATEADTNGVAYLKWIDVFADE
jgi:hypothetical protein